MKKLICGILLFISALIWGITFVAQSDASAHIEPFTFNFVRFLIGSAVLLPFIPIFGRFEAKKQRTALRLIQPRQLMKKAVQKSCLSAAFFWASCFALPQICSNWALQTATPSARPDS